MAEHAQSSEFACYVRNYTANAVRRDSVRQLERAAKMATAALLENLSTLQLRGHRAARRCRGMQGCTRPGGKVQNALPFNPAAIKEPSKYPNDDRKARSSADHKTAPTALMSGMSAGSRPNRPSSRATAAVVALPRNGSSTTRRSFVAAPAMALDPWPSAWARRGLFHSCCYCPSQ